MSAESFVQEQVSSQKVVVFSKSYCPFCKKAKAALFSLVSENSVVVFELDQRDDGDAIQDALSKVTGRRSVPQVFIAGQFTGGGDETEAAARDGTLKEKLSAAGVV